WAILVGVAEILGKLDPLAGRRLLFVSEVRQLGSGAWLVQRYDLTGEAGRRIESLELTGIDPTRLPRPERLYLDAAGKSGALLDLVPLHPLLVYDAEADEAFFLHSRKGKQKAEYVCYTNNRFLERADLGNEQRELLRRVLKMEVG